MKEQAIANGTGLRQMVNQDWEIWLKDRIQTAIRMALVIKAEQKVRADEDLCACALEGLANGAAVEIIHTLGMEPGYINLRKPPRYSRDNLPTNPLPEPKNEP